MIFCGPATKVTIRLRSNEAPSAPACEALLAFLSPKDVCGLQESILDGVIEIRFLARQGKVDALLGVVALIVPTAFICTENATIVHAKTSPRVDLMYERAPWESALRFRGPVAGGDRKNPMAPEEVPALPIPEPVKMPTVRRGDPRA